jgi:hypothetical protein
MNHSARVSWFAAVFSGERQIKCRHGDLASRTFLEGTLIHNGGCSQPAPISPLTIPLVQPPFWSLAMTTVRRSTLLPARFVAATVAAILMAPVTAAADPEYRAALRPPAKPLTEKIFSCVSHSRPKARLDNSSRSWQLNGGCVDNLSQREVLPMDPGRAHGRGLLYSTFRETIHEEDDGSRASGADDVEGISIPASVQKTTDSDDR